MRKEEGEIERKEEWCWARRLQAPCWDSGPRCTLTPSASSLTCAVSTAAPFFFYDFYFDCLIELNNCVTEKLICSIADPWEHVLGMGLGVVFAHQWVKFDIKSKEELDKILIKAKEANERRYFGKTPLSNPRCISFWIITHFE